MTTAQQSRVMTAPVMRAWYAALAEWDSTSPPSADENIAVIDRHYNVAPGVSDLPPTRLLAEWREAGHPDPNSWIKDKLEEILEAGTA
ncbi:MAG: hypothetical protein ACHQ4F_14280 [Candidatus Dormibacteria bacterium]